MSLSLSAPDQEKFQQAINFHKQNQIAPAQEIYLDIIKRNPKHFNILHLIGVTFYQSGNCQKAVNFINRAIEVNPYNPDFHYNCANALKDLGQFDLAIVKYNKTISLNPNYVEAYYNRGGVLKEMGKLDAALASCNKAIYLNPHNPFFYLTRGIILRDLKQYDLAIFSYDKAIQLKPDYAEAYLNRGNVFFGFGKFETAIASYDKAIEIWSAYCEAYFSRAGAFAKLKQLDKAMEDYDKVIYLKPDWIDAHISRGNVLTEYNNFELAVESYDKAIELDQNCVEAYYRRGNALKELKRIEEALISYDKVQELKPDYKFLLGTIMNAKNSICDWATFDAERAEMELKILKGEKVAAPFDTLSIIDSPEMHLKAAETWVQFTYPENNKLGTIVKRERNEKIRIGYYSADFHAHAMGYLLANLYEFHDKSKFELIAFSFGQDRDDETRKRIAAAFDKFIDVRLKNDEEIATLSREIGIDVAIDLNGFTQNMRMGIFAFRCAPIQVNYLGYPGTMAAPYMDYIIADKIVISPENKKYYSEKIAYLPNSYQPNDSKREILDKNFTRQELGLPKDGFVFCCFNNNFKILPQTFESWMRILKAVPASVIWLFEDNESAAKNLRKEAEKRGVESGRLIFAKRTKLEDHLARKKFADLFLDTLPYNAHTTCSDALWAGLPVLTLIGKSFASRVAASLLTAIELPELITNSEQEFEAKAIELALNSEKLKELKLKLEKHKLTTPLFDTKLFTKHIEAIYEEMYEKYQADLAPSDIEVRDN